MPERICPECKVWICAADDAYCGSCGRPCAALSLEALPAVTPVGEVSPVALKFHNASCAPARIRSCSFPVWFRPAKECSGTVAPGESLVIRGRASAQSVDTSPAVIATDLGDATAPLMAIPAQVRLIANPDRFEFWNFESTAARAIEVSVQPDSGTLRVTSTGSARAAWIRPSPLTAPQLISAGEPLAVQLLVDEADLARRLRAEGSKASAQIDLDYDGPHGPASASFELTFHQYRAPELIWVDAFQPPRRLAQMDRQTLEIVLANRIGRDESGGRRNATLTINSAVLRAADLALPAQLLSSDRLRIRGGETGVLIFELDLRSIPAGLVNLELAVETNANPPDRIFTVPVDVQPVEVFDGMIAIDFGTSNTCCAVLEREQDEPHAIPIDGPSTTAPTVVRYLALDGPRPEIEIGIAAKIKAAVDEAASAATLSQLKQHLGAANLALPLRPERSQLWTRREVREAAADYLGHVRSAAERKLGTVFREFVLTHPAVCSIRQYRNLRFALDRAFGTTEGARVDFLPEPVAALVPFIDAHSRRSNPQDYTLASFDLGGGTTDITVLEVNYNRPRENSLEIRPRIVTSWGERFGGEDLTTFLQKEILSRCRVILEQRRLNLTIAERGVFGASTTDALRNNHAIRDWAETFKARLSEENGQGQARASQLILSCVHPDAFHKPESVMFSAEDLAGSGAAALDTLFLKQVREQVERLAGRLAGSIPSPDWLNYIQLSGKTTFLPVVGAVLRERFPNTSIERAGDPKECVVQGACIFRAMSRNRVRRLIFSTQMARTTSNIGVKDPDTGAFVTLIPYDRAIPAEGLEGVAVNYWNGEAPVVLWEQLDLTGNSGTPLTVLGKWEPAHAPGVSDVFWTLRVRLNQQFELEVDAYMDERQVGFRSARGVAA